MGGGKRSNLGMLLLSNSSRGGRGHFQLFILDVIFFLYCCHWVFYTEKIGWEELTLFLPVYHTNDLLLIWLDVTSEDFQQPSFIICILTVHFNSFTPLFSLLSITFPFWNTKKKSTLKNPNHFFFSTCKAHWRAGNFISTSSCMSMKTLYEIISLSLTFFFLFIYLFFKNR